ASAPAPPGSRPDPFPPRLGLTKRSQGAGLHQKVRGLQPWQTQQELAPVSRDRRRLRREPSACCRRRDRARPPSRPLPSSLTAPPRQKVPSRGQSSTFGQWPVHSKPAPVADRV